MIGNGLVDGGRITDAAAVSSCAGIRDQRSGISGQPQPRGEKRKEGRIVGMMRA